MPDADISPRRPMWLLLMLTLLLVVQLRTALHYLFMPASIAHFVDPALRSALIVLSVTWAGLFVLGIIKVWGMHSAWRNRSLWLILVFITYSGVRLMILSEADYDRQRLPIVAALLFFCLAVGGTALLIGLIRRSNDNDGDKNL